MNTSKRMNFFKLNNIVPMSLCLGLSCVATWMYYSTAFSEGKKVEESKMAAIHLLNRGVENENKVKYFSKGHEYSMFFTPREVIYALQKELRQNSHSHFLRFQFIGSQLNPELKGLEQKGSKLNNSIAKGKENFPNFGKVAYENLYDGITATFSGNNEKFKYEFMIASGANFNDICFHVEGAEKLSIDSSGNLCISIKDEKIVMQRPTMYQEEDGKKMLVDGKFDLLEENNIGFVVSKYDATKPLVIN